MKIEGKNIRFLPPSSFLGRNGLYFVGRANSIQLLDTALVIEGDQKVIGLFVVDLFFRQALSEWTTVTIPYSRIVKCQYSRQLLKMLAFFLLIFLPILAIIALSLAGEGGFSAQEWIALVIVAVFMLIPIGLLFLVFYFVFDIGPRTTLIYRRPDGRSIRIAFRIRPSALREKFLARLEANRKAAANAGAALAKGA